MKTKLKSNNFLIISIISFILFFVIIILLKNVDVKKTGLENTEIGLSTINFFIRDLIGSNLLWYTITDWVGVIGIVVAFCFAILGLVQWIKRKNMLKVDFEILMLGILYLLVIGTYILFEFIIINYRPIIIYKFIEASFPSSHTFITCTIMATLIPLSNKYFKNKKPLNIILNIFSLIVIAITIIGRIISGVHWITDIVSGVILSIAFVSMYIFVLSLNPKTKNNREIK